MRRRFGDEDYRKLLHFRDGIRRFLAWSASQAGAQGLTPMQHQLLLAIRGHDDALDPTIGDVAEHLLIRHHSAVELVDRAAGAGLVERRRDPADGRVVRLGLTRLGQDKLEALAEAHLEELKRLVPPMMRIWEGLGADEGSARDA